MYAQILSQIRDQSELLFATQRFNATQNVFVGRRHTLFSWLHCTNSAPIAPLTRSTVNCALFQLHGPLSSRRILSHEEVNVKDAMQPFPETELLSVKKLAQILDCSPKTVHDWLY